MVLSIFLHNGLYSQWKSYFVRCVVLGICALFLGCNTLTNGDYLETVGGLQLHYTIKGKGPVLIVGHPNSGKIGYELSLQPLEKYFTVVYYEPRGTGSSEAPPTLKDYQQAAVVDEIEFLRKKLEVSTIWLFGHSDQSAIALLYALKYPKTTSGLILSGTSYVGTQQETYARRSIAEQKRMHESNWFTQVVHNWDYMVTHETTYNVNGKDISDAPLKWWCYDEETSKKVLPIVKEIDKAGRRKPVNNKYFVESKEDRQAYLENQNKFDTIHAKVLLLNGKFDTNNPPEYAEQLEHLLPNATLVLIDKAGHFPWIENPEATFSEIGVWLNDNI